MMMEITGLTVDFGGVRALDHVDLNMEQGIVFAIIGPNGAGKTTLFNCVSGLIKPSGGSIEFQGKELIGLRPDQTAGLGIGRTFQNINLFTELTVTDNILIATHIWVRTNILTEVLPFKKARNEEKKARDKIDMLLALLDLTEHKDAVVADLPLGIQKRIELARALALEPTLLLLDEPVSGMNDAERVDMSKRLRDIYEELKLTVVVIDHNISWVMQTAHRIAVLDFGLKIAEGSSEEVQKNPHVIEAYLGKEQDATTRA